MKVTEVIVEQLRNTGNYENIKVGVKILVGENESPHEAVERGKRFIHNELYGTAPRNYSHYKKIVDNPMDYTGKQVAGAQEWLEKNPIEVVDF